MLCILFKLGSFRVFAGPHVHEVLPVACEAYIFNNVLGIACVHARSASLPHIDIKP